MQCSLRTNRWENRKYLVSLWASIIVIRNFTKFVIWQFLRDLINCQLTKILKLRITRIEALRQKQFLVEIDISLSAKSIHYSNCETFLRALLISHLPWTIWLRQKRNLTTIQSSMPRDMPLIGISRLTINLSQNVPLQNYLLNEHLTKTEN